MRKLLILALVMVLAVACIGKREKKSEQVVVEGNVFSNAYDGFLTLRDEPNAKACELEVMYNGPKGATMVQYHPKWSIVRYNGVEGYVKTEYLQTSPTKPVYVNADVVLGAWCMDSESFPHYHDLLIFDNATYLVYNDHCCEGSFTSVGHWKLEEDCIVLTEYYDLFANFEVSGGENYLKSNNVTKFRVDMTNYTLTEVTENEDAEPMVLVPESDLVRKYKGRYHVMWSGSLEGNKEIARSYIRGY